MGLTHWSGTLVPPDMRFRAAVFQFDEQAGRKPDRNWRALLRCLTASQGVWDRTKGFLDFASRTAHLSEIPLGEWSHGERLLVEVGWNLFNHGIERVDLQDLADTLGPIEWEAVVSAMRIYRGETP